MKKLYFFFPALLFFCNLHSQVIFSEDFDGINGPTAGGAGTYVFPSGWFLRNVDNRTPDANVAYVNDAWERREDFNFNVADSCAFSTSWYSPAGPSDDWMWTPLVGPLPANCELTWNAVTYDPMYQDGYEVRIMTSASGPPTGGTGTLGNQVSNSTVIFSTAAENSSWTSHTVNLNSYSGQSVYIGFRNNSNDKFLLLIDDIKVQVVLNYDAAISSVTRWSEYSQTPLPQAAALPLQATVTNNGSQPVTNTTLLVDVYDQTNTVVHSASANMGTINAGGSTVFTLAPFTPTAVGAYHAQFQVLITETDQATGNNTYASDTLLVTDSIYARDKGAVTGALGIGAGNGYVGQQFNVVNSDQLTSVTWGVTRGYTGRRLATVVWDMVSGVPNQIVAYSDTLLYIDDSARVYTAMINGGPVTLAPGMYAVTAIEFDSTVQVALTNDIYTAGTTWVNWVGNPFGAWSNNEDFGSQYGKSYMIRANFADVCLALNATETSTDATCGSCADGSASVSAISGYGPFTYLWSSGGTSATENNLLPGVYTVTVSGQFGCTITDTVIVNNSCTSFSASIDTSAAATCGTCADGMASVITTNGVGSLTYLWSNGDTAMTADSLVPGTYIVTVTDSAGCSDTASVTITFTTGMNAMNTGNAIQIFPNPTDGDFTLATTLTGEGDVEIFNALGECITREHFANVAEKPLRLSIGTAGIYTVKVRTKDGVQTLPVMVK